MVPSIGSWEYPEGRTSERTAYGCEKGTLDATSSPTSFVDLVCFTTMVEQQIESFSRDSPDSSYVLRTKTHRTHRTLRRKELLSSPLRQQPPSHPLSAATAAFECPPSASHRCRHSRLGRRTARAWVQRPPHRSTAPAKGA